MRELTCPCCGAMLAVTSDRDLGAGETGGTCTIVELACAGCAAEITYRVVEKYGYVDEAWSLHAPPRTADAARATHRCPRCDGGLVGARPPDATDDHLRPQPPTVRRATAIDHVCVGCGASFLAQSGEWHVLTAGRYEPLAAPPPPVVPTS
jgi:hypothetical protein